MNTNKIPSAKEVNAMTRIPHVNLKAAEKEQERQSKIEEERKSDTNIDLTPLNNGVVVAFTGEKKTDAGIVLTEKDGNADDPQQVLAVGPMVKDLKKNDWVIIRLGTRPDTFIWKKKKYLYFREHDILCKINDNK